MLVGRPEVIEPHLGTGFRRKFGERLRIQRASEVVAMDEPPALRRCATRRIRRCAWRSISSNGEAQAAVSAGNTGALMAISRFVLKTPRHRSPGDLQHLPSMRGQTHMLDLGANVDCSPEHLLQFGIMGAMLVAAVELQRAPSSVGLPNIGEEDIKGNEIVKQAANCSAQQRPQLLRQRRRR